MFPVVTAARFMGFLPVAGKGGDNALVGSEDRVEDEIGGSQGTGLGHGLMHRVVVQVSGDGPLVFAAAVSGVQYGKVAVHACLSAGDTWQNALASASEAGKIVESDDTGQYQALRLGRRPVDADIDTVGSPADGDQVCLIVTVVIMYPDTSVQCAENFLMLVVRLSAMNPECDQDFDVSIGNALAIEPFHQQGQVHLAAGIAGNVGGDDDDLFTWPEGGDGSIACVECRGDDRFGRCRRFGNDRLDDAGQAFRGEVKRK